MSTVDFIWMQNNYMTRHPFSQKNKRRPEEIEHLVNTYDSENECKPPSKTKLRRSNIGKSDKLKNKPQDLRESLKRKRKEDVFECDNQRQPFEYENQRRKKQKKTCDVRKKDSNLQRSLPKRVICNGQYIDNKFRSKVKSSDVEFVTSYFSHYATDRTGRTKSELISNLVSVIKEYGKNKTVLGCIAWLSSAEVLDALKTCRRVLLIINREDYERWGGGGMLKKYLELPKFDEPLSVAFEHLETVLATLENNRTKGKSRYSSVRAFGNPSFTIGGVTKCQGLEHCKYLIFFESQCHVKITDETNDQPNFSKLIEISPMKKEGQEYVYKDVPCAVWTGSMNMTKASETHHENAVFIKSERTAMAYMHDFSETFMSSVPVTSKNKQNTPKQQLKYKSRFLEI